jgi:TPR repeat protein
MSYRKELEMLARHGNAAAQCDLARLYHFGTEVRQDHEAAAKWFLLAAEQGHAQAQINVAILYTKGHGVPQDAVRALMWSLIEDAGAKGEAQELRDIIAATMSEEEIFMARRMALKWRPRRRGAFHYSSLAVPPLKIVQIMPLPADFVRSFFLSG